MISEWLSKPLGELISYISKGIPPKYAEKETDSTIAVLNQKCNRNYRINYDNARLHDTAKKTVPQHKMIQSGDVLINATGTGTAGRVAQIVHLPRPTTIDGHMILLRPVREIDPFYFGYAVKLHQSKIESLAEGSTGQTEINRQRLCDEIIIRYPADIKMQKEIAALFCSIDDKISLNNAINENLEQQAQAIFYNLVQQSNAKIKLSELIYIKHGYAFKGDFISAEDNNIVLVTPGNFKIGGGFKEERCKFYNGNIPSEYILSPGQLIVTMTDLSKNGDTLGYSAFVPSNSKRIYLHNQRIGLVQPLNKNIPIDYIYCFLRSYDYHCKIVGSASGSTVKHTSPDRICQQYIPIPPNDMLLKNSDYLKSINNKIALNNAENQHLAVLRDTLLPKLMNGDFIQ